MQHLSRHAWLGRAAGLLIPLVAVGCGDDGGGTPDAATNQNNTPPVAVCGNGIVELLEACDNGAANSDSQPDACRTTCVLPSCGDNVVDTGEVCDSGRWNSDVLDGACRKDCTPARCGDGVVDTLRDETCDDGNTEAGDGCGATCIQEFCGNGLPDPGEACDDGNVLAGDGCSPDCLSDESCGNGAVDLAVGETCDCGTDGALLPPGCEAPNGAAGGSCSVDCVSISCGNGVLDAYERCDDGNHTDGDGCSADCRSDESCGNGIADFAQGETCDCGTDLANLPPGCTETNGAPGGRCRVDCQLAYCGNGRLDDGEVCDDGANLAGDGCSADCRSDESCGNGIVDGSVGEACDDGNRIDGDGCQAICAWPNCGDGTLDPGEVCDDGNNVGGDGCNARCTSDETCPNQVIDLAAGEQCEDGNTVDGDGCNHDCRRGRCGDGQQDPSEACDDGNTLDGDGCSASCRSDETCGNGYLDPGEACDDGNTAGGDGCSADCQSDETCGNGILDPGEPCDDGNAVETDDCLTGCRLPTCGDGAAWSGHEVCDDGNTADGDGCSADCQSDESCGNGILDPGEVCDDGNTTGGDDCSADCHSDETCGNGIQDPGEPCDDGNLDDSDDCLVGCVLPQCGDGILWVGREGCDDGNFLSHDGCSSGCTVETPVWVQLSASPAPPVRQNHVMTYDPVRHRVLLHAGGSVYRTTDRHDTWAFDGAWTDLAPVTNPGDREGAQMIFMEGLGVAIRFGGFKCPWCTIYDDTWQFNGTNWSVRSPASKPGRREAHSMAYDSDRDVIVVFGGGNGTGIYWEDTWEYDGTTWAQRTTPNNPGSRIRAGMAYDASRMKMVLFGGHDPDTSTTLNDTWEYDAVTGWEEVVPASLTPLPQGNVGTMYYDPLRRRVVLSRSAMNLYEWDGVDWTLIVPAARPPVGRWTERGAYDRIRRQLVIFGGTTSNGVLGDTWAFRWASGWPDETCDNGVDDDFDGLVDCADPDCDTLPCATGSCAQGVCQ